MSNSSHRGVVLRRENPDNRKTCPLCKRSGIKVIYEQDVDEKKIVTCKQCHAAVGHGKMKNAIQAVL